MPDTPLIPSDQDKTPRSYSTELPRSVEFAELPPGMTGLTFQQWVFVHAVSIFLGAISGVYSRETITDRELYEGVHSVFS